MKLIPAQTFNDDHDQPRHRSEESQTAWSVSDHKRQPLRRWQVERDSYGSSMSSTRVEYGLGKRISLDLWKSKARIPQTRHP
jgi:hypothetical protein